VSEQNYFDAVNWQEIEPQGAGREVFSVDGWHKVIVADSKGASNSKNTGMLFTAYLKCLEGPDSGKTIDENINVFHQNPQAQEIGQRQFSAYCHALGEFKPIDNHASNFRNKPLMARTETVDEEFQNSQPRRSSQSLVNLFTLFVGQVFIFSQRKFRLPQILTIFSIG